MAAIANDPDTVMEYFQTLSQNLYDALSDKMSATSLSSAFTIYNDKEMSSQYSDYKKKVSEWEEKLKDIEDSYYKKFAKWRVLFPNCSRRHHSFQAYLEIKRLDRYNTEEI